MKRRLRQSPGRSHGTFSRTARVSPRKPGGSFKGSRGEARAMAEVFPGMHWLSDLKGRWTFANTALAAFAGAGGRTLLGDGWLAVVHPDDRTIVRESVAAALRARQPFKIECRVSAATGDIRWCAISGMPRSRGRRCLGFAGTVMDFTARANAQQAARTMALRFRALSEASGRLCIGIRGDGEVLFWNSAAEDATGIAASRAVGAVVSDLFPGVPGGVLRNMLTAGSAHGRTAVLALPLQGGGSRATLDCVVHPCGQEYLLCALDPGPTASAGPPVQQAGRSDAAAVPPAPDLASILGGADDLITFQDVEGRYLTAVGGAQSGLSAQGLVGRLPEQLFDPDVAAAIREHHRKVLETADHVTGERRVVLHATPSWYLDHLSPVRNSDGTLAGVVTISRDITEQKLAAQRLEESEQRYRTFVENSNDGIWRWETREPIPTRLRPEDQVRHMLEFAYVAECNPPAARLYGYARPKDMVGVLLKTILHGDTVTNQTLLHEFIRNGYCLTNTEIAHAHRDGTPHHTLHNLVGTVEHGCLVRAWGSIRDISDQKQAERRLRLLAHTITSTRDCVTLTDLDDRILYVNDAFLHTYGYTEEELLGKDISIVRPDERDPAIAQGIRRATREDGWNGELINRRANGTLFPVELWTSTVFNDEGEPVAMVGVARDITERKQAEEELRTSLREKEVLLKEIHHRVKNNLQVISSLLSLQSEYLKDEQMIKALKESQNRVRSMALIHEKLYQSRNLAEIDFSDYVRELTTQLLRSYGIGAHGVNLNVQASQVLLAVDRAIPCGIIVNELVTNALKYAFRDRQGGQIDVELEPVEADRVRLAIRDNGVGLPADLDFETSDTLGLTLVRMLADQVQGDIRVHSGEPGAEFVLTFRR